MLGFWVPVVELGAPLVLVGLSGVASSFLTGVVGTAVDGFLCG